MLVLLAGRSLEEALNSVWTLLGTSFGLTISALVTAVRNELPLYQAIIVTDLVWLANWAIFMALATYVGLSIFMAIIHTLTMATESSS